MMGAAGGYLPCTVHTGEGVLAPVLVKAPLHLPVQGLLVVVLVNAVLQAVAAHGELQSDLCLWQHTLTG